MNANKDRLARMVRHAIQTVPYYNKYRSLYLDGDFSRLERLPLIDKKYCSKPVEEILSSCADPDDLFVSATSGTTGTPTRVYKVMTDMVRAGRSLWTLRKKWYGVDIHDMYVTFSAKDVEVSVERNNIVFSLLHISDKDFSTYYEMLIKYDVKWIFAVPSVMCIFAKYIVDNSLEAPKCLKYIELSGEYAMESTKKYLEKVFECKVGSLYGLTECAGVAMRCPNGRFHVLEQNVHVEILNNEGITVEPNDVGMIYITALNNYSVPLIRYKTGDTGFWPQDQKCSCGCDYSIIELSSGRETDYIVRTDGSLVHSIIFFRAIENVNCVLSDVIVAFQAIQREYDAFDIVIALNDLEKEEPVKEVFLDYMYEYGLPKEYFAFYCTGINDSMITNGKLRFFRSEVAKSNIKWLPPKGAK